MMNTFRKYVLTLLFFLPFVAKSQNAIEPYIGYNVDVNNKGAFSQVSIGLQYPVVNKPIYQLLIGVRAGLPLNKQTGIGTAYTFDQTLPLKTSVGYTTKWYSYSLLLQNRIRVASWANHKNAISAIINVGLTRQKIAARNDSYDWDKYTILNPQTTATKNGVFVGIGTHYKHVAPGGFFFFQIDINSPPIAKKLDSYYYNNPAPFGMHFGYIVNFKKKE